jgi:hypothetical protein
VRVTKCGARSRMDRLRMKTSHLSKSLCTLLALSLVWAAEIAQAQTMLMDTNQVWRYLGDGSDQGTAWRDPQFIDSAWLSGPGRLGFGGDGEQTVVGDAANGFVTFYFRTTVNVPAAGLLVVRYVRDDGLVFYINGQEVFRSNMPGAPAVIDYLTQADAVVSGAAESEFFTNTIPASMVIPGDNVIAVEVHQRHGTPPALSSDLGFYLELFADIPPQPPTVTLNEPDNNDIIQGSSVTFFATASDIDATINQVQFFLNATSGGIDTTAPYHLVANSVAPGNYTVTAVATDSQGLSATSAPAMITVVAALPSLVPFGATWRYLDNGSDQGTAWKDPGFVDTSWATGPAELGYGDDDEATIVSFGGDPNNKFITTYFRHTFNVASPASISSLTLRVVRDDGVAIYLNGTEILRDNLPSEPLTYLTQATNTVEDAPIVVASVNPALLRSGANVIAAEIHQATNTSSDISFDLNLIHNANVPPTVVLTAPPNGTNLLSPATFNIAATAYDLDGAINNVQFFVSGALVGTPDMTVPYGRTATGVQVGQHTVSAIATDNSGRTGVVSVAVTVLPGVDTSILIPSNSVWRYLDDGSDQGEAWRALAFVDSSWPSGAAELGFGDGDEQTVIRSNRVDDLTKITTFYFRKVFNVPDPTTYTNLVILLRRDDGAVVYINGTEVFRSNMTNDVGVPILYTDFAGGATGSETAFNVTNASPSVLVPGQNIIAVEVHQQSPDSSDVSFELVLEGQRPAGPGLRIVNNGTTGTLSWFPTGGGFVLQQSTTVAGPWTASASQSNPQTVTFTGGTRFFRLCSSCP